MQPPGRGKPLNRARPTQVEAASPAKHLTSTMSFSKPGSFSKLGRWLGSVLAAAAIAAAATVPQGRARAAETAPEVLRNGEAMRFVASETTRWRVRLPGPVASSKVFFTFQGEGRVAAAFLRESDRGPENGGALIAGYAIGRCQTEGCATRGRQSKFYFPMNVGRILSAGDYDVVVVADSTPVAATLRLDAPRRAPVVRRARSGRPARSQILTLPVRPGSVANTYTAGAFNSWSKRAPTFGLVGLWVDADGYIGTNYGHCYYYEGDALDVPEDLAFMPGCPTGDAYRDTFVSQEPGAKGGAVLVSGNLGAPTGIGVWHSTAAAELLDQGAVGLWLDL